MKEQYIGYRYSFYEYPNERKLILKKTDVYAKCRVSKIEKLKHKLIDGNTMTLYMLSLLLEQPHYRGWKVVEEQESKICPEKI